MENNRWWNRIIDKLIFWRKPQNEEIKNEEETKLKASGKCGRQRRRARAGLELSPKLRFAALRGGIPSALQGGELTFFSGKRPVGINRKPGKRNEELCILSLYECYSDDTGTIVMKFEEGTNIRDGVVSWFRVFDNAGAPAIDGSVGYAPHQFHLNSYQFIEGAAVNIDTFTISIPGE